MMTLEQALPWLDGARLCHAGQTPVQRVHTDTRSIAPGDLFLALKGEHFDANTLLAQARASGAVAAICHPGAAGAVEGFPCIEVPDTRRALAQLASAWRQRFTLPLIGVTGSNGKTTVTQMLAAILDAHCPGGAALATRGNFNNDIGVPLTLLRLRAQHRIAVVELGMNHPGEIATLAALARPTVALVNNAQREHLEFMHTVQAVAQENGAVLSALPADGVAVFPAHDAYTTLWQGLAAGRRSVRFAEGPGAGPDELRCVAAHWDGECWQVQAQGLDLELRYRLRIAGRHNIRNSLAAAACALAAGVGTAALQHGLEQFMPVKGRSHAMALDLAGHRLTLVDDSYNANPDSVHAAIDVLADLPGPRLLVLGDMGEVGSEGVQLHAAAGRYAEQRGIEQLLTLGVLARHASEHCAGARHFDALDDLQAAVRALLPTRSSMLVKGSRFMRMERVVEAVRADAAAAKESADAN
ncbi:MAG: UDP-N-acetylmuramoyl-tripeptide--D-alanyl-D-alanine ligase [Rhodoferax sp.]